MRKDTSKGKLLEKKSSVKDLEKETCLVFSFRHLCPQQGASFKNWLDDGVLLDALEKLKGYSNHPYTSTDATYTIYGNFPPKSKFKHPKYVPEDAKWARIHVNGKYIICGHLVKNIFYIVFLDSEHGFWITEKKHT